jgi:putative ABC transport system substrate-binding protein
MPFDQLKRRKFITLLGGGAAAWPLAARAQQGLLPVVGVLRPNPKGTDQFVEPFRRYMRAIGWEEGRNSVSWSFGPRAATSERPRWPRNSSDRTSISSSPLGTLPSELRNA